MKFIQFGCWNQFKCNIEYPINPLSNVMKKLNDYAKKEHPDFIIISGDNYYNEKIHVKKGKIEEKKKIIHLDDLIAGIQCLPPEIEINMILGNHDLESKKSNLYISGANISEANISEAYIEKGNCLILNTQKKTINERVEKTGQRFHYEFFMTKYDVESETLILMIDTSIYDEEDAEEMLICYKYMLAGNNSTVDEIRQYQEKQIRDEIKKCKRDGKIIKNLIISGHHPITSYKVKINEKKPDKTKFDIIKGFPKFIDLLKEIYTMMIGNNTVNYYYLCADLHLYQKGIVRINISDRIEMEINQYIVGTGGTELDPNPFDPIYAGIEGRLLNQENGINIKVDINVNYQMTKADVNESYENYGHGFLECIIQKEPIQSIFRFIKVQKAQAHVQAQMQAQARMQGGKKQTRKNKKKNKKKRTRKYKTKYKQKNHPRF